MPNPATATTDDGHHKHPVAAAISGNRDSPSPATLITVFLDSFKILVFNPRLFISIFLLLGLPLSLLLSSLSLSSATIRRRISHLESLSALISVRIEALNILDEARKDSKHLFRLRVAYALPTLLLSTLLLIASASSTASRRRLSLSDLRAAVISAWWRALITAIVGHVAIAGCGQLMRTAAVAIDAVAGPAAGVAIGFLSGGLEIYLTAVFGMGAVVAVVEERFGVEAVRVGWGLMEGRRKVVGWAVMGAVAASTGVIGWEMVGVEEIDVYGGDWKGFESTAGMEFGRRAGLVLLYGLLLVWSNVVFTVFYCDCRKKLLVVDDVDDDDRLLLLVDNVSPI